MINAWINPHSPRADVSDVFIFISSYPCRVMDAIAEVSNPSPYLEDWKGLVGA